MSTGKTKNMAQVPKSVWRDVLRVTNGQVRRSRSRRVPAEWVAERLRVTVWSRVVKVL